MLRLASMIFPVASATLMGALIVAALATGYDTSTYVVIAAAIGAVLALPVSYFVARAINNLD